MVHYGEPCKLNELWSGGMSEKKHVETVLTF